MKLIIIIINIISIIIIIINSSSKHNKPGKDYCTYGFPIASWALPKRAAAVNHVTAW